MPIGKETAAYVGFRSHRDLHNNVLEYSLLLKLNYQTNRVDAVVRVADSVTLYDQLMSLHRKNQTESIESLKKQLKIKEFRTTEADCPALRSQFKKFSKIKFRTPDPYLISLHPTVHEFQVNPVSEYMRLVVVESDHPLVVWAMNTGRIVETCVERNNRGK